MARFYVVEDGTLKERFMCDNRECDNYRTRLRGIHTADAKIGFQVFSMEKFDACSEGCRSKIIEQERLTCDISRHC